MDTKYNDQDPRGPERRIVAVDCSPTTHTAVTLSCGHVGEWVAHHSYRVGDRAHCFACRSAPTAEGLSAKASR